MSHQCDSAPFAPLLVTPDESHGGTAPILTLTGAVNGEIVQQTTTDELVFGPVALVQYASTICTLHPGDVNATGTPGWSTPASPLSSSQTGHGS